MKKYLLLILLIAVVFFWWGNLFVSATCEDKNNSTSSYSSYLWSSGSVDHKFTCEDDSPRNNACPDKTQVCVWGWTNCNKSWKSCCICNQPLTPMTPKGVSNNTAPEELSPLCSTNEVLNSVNVCECKPWYGRDSERVCKPCSDPGICCGIKLNTSVPFIGKCIESRSTDVWTDEAKWVTETTAFPVLMGSLTKILVTAILIISFVLIVIGGIMIASGNPSWGKSMIRKVVIGIAILWASGVILRLINPNFFG